MNRRSFVTKALAGLAAVPLLAKLVNSQPRPQAMLIVRGPTDSSKSGYFTDECPFDFAASTRARILREVKEFGESNLCVSEMTCAFGKWEHGQIEAWCNEHELVIYARPDGRIIVKQLWGYGSVDGVVVYDHQLSWAEIQQQYEAAKQLSSASS